MNRPPPAAFALCSRRRRFVFLPAALLLLSGWRCRTSPEVPVCSKIRAESLPRVRSFLPADPAARDLLGSHGRLACPEAERSFFEWYFLILHTDRYYLEAALWTQGAHHQQGFAGLALKEARTMKPIFAERATGEEIRFADSGCEVQMWTEGPEGRGESYLVFHDQGASAGKFELKIQTRTKRLHLFLTPQTPGMISDQLAEDRTRRGSWYQFSAPFLMAAVQGELADFQKKPATLHPFPGPEAPRPHAYLEHMWGQVDTERFYWDWGEFEDMENQTALLYSQAEPLSGGIGAFLVLARRLAVPVKLTISPPAEQVRVAYSRFFPERHGFYPQQTHVFAFGQNPPAAVNMTGFILGRYHDYLAVNLHGSAWTDTEMSVWQEKPARSAIQFFKGAQTENRHPASARELKVNCGEKGCALSWRHPLPAPGGVEYWIFRGRGQNRLQEGIPIGVVESEETGASLGFFDPAGSAADFYTILPLARPETLIHQRFTAGYAVCSRPAQESSAAEAVPRLLSALAAEAAGSFQTPLTEELIVKEAEGEERKIRLQKKSGALQIVLQEQRTGTRRILPPLFSPHLQLQSLAGWSLGEHELVLAWSERSRIMNSEYFTDWEVFAALYDLSSGNYRIFPVSMSEEDSVEAELKVSEDFLVVSYLECGGGSCRKFEQKLRAVGP